MAEDFRTYYATGLRMTEAYIQEGTHQGNVIMKQFDQQADQLLEGLRPFLGTILEEAGLQEFQVSLARQALENTLIILWAMLIVLILLATGTTGWLLRS